MTNTNLLLVGCGKMGGALLQRMAGRVTACVVDPAPPQQHLKSLPGISWLSGPDKIDAGFKPEIIILAVKPQLMAGVLPAYAKFRESLFLSIAAGQTIARLAQLLGGEGYAIARAMPNLPASIGAGMTVAVANKKVNTAQRTLAGMCLTAVGAVAWIEDEGWLDAVTALSGSGPAYIFALVEAMAKAGEALGLPSALAMQLARQTVIGSGALLEQSKESAEALCEAVTSPGGTTEAALKLLLAEEGGLFDVMQKAMKAAALRARDLSDTKPV